MPRSTAAVLSKITETEIKRVIGSINTSDTGPIVIFFGGIHGNEPAGVLALQKLFNELSAKDIHGTLIGIAGNLAALNSKQRFIDEDLNRMWTEDRVGNFDTENPQTQELREMHEIYKNIKWVFKTKNRPVYFIDFHTTSSITAPFITINDAIINRRFSQHFPVPIVLGIEEYLNGPLLSYINTKGYVSLGFEAGQHDEETSIENAYSFAIITLLITGTLTKSEGDLKKHKDQLKPKDVEPNGFFQIAHLERLKKFESFSMKPGFKSFQPINKGELLALKDQRLVEAPKKGLLFMPLYQKTGREGFFIINRVPKAWLRLSTFLRKLKLDSFLTLLPGVHWKNKKEGVLSIHLKVARFFAKDIFHLLGYRSRKIDATHLLMYNRDRVAKKQMYQNLLWYKPKN